MNIQRHIGRSLRLSSAALCVLLALSCQKEQFRFTTGSPVSFGVTTSGSTLTKTVYSGEEYSNGSNKYERIDWQADDDMIRIYCAEASKPDTKWADYVVIENGVPSAATSVASIEAVGEKLLWGPEDVEHTFYAIYPSPSPDDDKFPSVGESQVNAVCNISETQSPRSFDDISAEGAEHSNFVASADMNLEYMVAKRSITNNSEAGSDIADWGDVLLKFKPVVTAIEFTIENGTTKDTGGDLLIKSISLTSKSHNIAGTLTIAMSGLSDDGDVYPECQCEGAQTVTMDFTNIPDYTYDGDKKYIKLKKGDALRFTMFLSPDYDDSTPAEVINIADLTFQINKANADGTDGGWMKTFLGYTDGSGIVFPCHKKTFVKGLIVPDGAQWTVKYGSAGENDADAVTTVTKWLSGDNDKLNFSNEDDMELLSGKFSVSQTEYVQFSRGNLQAVLGNDNTVTEWKLAKNQYSFIGNAAGNTTLESGSSIDLFGWSVEGAVATFGISASKDNSDYGTATNDNLDDWGTEYSQQMGYPSDTWFTMSKSEWKYLLSERANAVNLYRNDVVVCGIEHCLILAPDNYKGSIESEYTPQTWQPAEDAGLVCLPPAGYRKETDVTNGVGCYFTGTPNENDAAKAYMVSFKVGQNPVVMSDERCCGRSVRLVQKFDDHTSYVKIGNLYWATENLAVTESGRKEFNGTGHIIGDYFQWAASYNGYNLTGEAKTPENLVLYSSFTSKQCGDGSSAFAFRVTGQNFQQKYAPFYVSAYTKYDKTTTALELGDDVASICWGGSWRLPTEQEFSDMKAATYWEWDATDKGYYVYRPTHAEDGGKINTNKKGSYEKADAILFFPAPGRGINAGFESEGSYGYYWLSVHSTTDVGYARRLQIYNNNTSGVATNQLQRYYGCSIRPVCPVPTVNR